MRSIYLVPGLVLNLLGATFALQGAGVVPTTFMNGPSWIVIGAVIFLAGLGLDLAGVRARPSMPQP